jgi:hypothetical protein
MAAKTPLLAGLALVELFCREIDQATTRPALLSPCWVLYGFQFNQ